MLRWQWNKFVFCHIEIIRQFAKLRKQIITTPDNGYMIAGMEGVLTNDTVKAYALKIRQRG